MAPNILTPIQREVVMLGLWDLVSGCVMLHHVVRILMVGEWYVVLTDERLRLFINEQIHGDGEGGSKKQRKYSVDNF
jgi:hypothetical protein